MNFQARFLLSALSKAHDSIEKKQEARKHLLKGLQSQLSSLEDLFHKIKKTDGEEIESIRHKIKEMKKILKRHARELSGVH